MWGSYVEIKRDEMVGLDNCIRTECPNIAMCKNLLQPKKKGRLEEWMPKKKTRRAPCNHGIYQDQTTHGGEQNAAHCGKGHCLHGLKCAGKKCGAAF
jgi:hypothetical protein